MPAAAAPPQCTAVQLYITVACQHSQSLQWRPLVVTSSLLFSWSLFSQEQPRKDMAIL